MTTFRTVLNYQDPLLDFSLAKSKIIEHYKVNHEEFEKIMASGSQSSSFISDIIENWAYAADLLSSKIADDFRNANLRLEKLLGWSGVHSIGVDHDKKRFEVLADRVVLDDIRHVVEAVAHPFSIDVVSTTPPTLL